MSIYRLWSILSSDWGVRILDFRFWIKELKFNPKDALYETLRVACFFAGVRGLALSVGAASRREAMPLAQPLQELALRCAIVNPKSKI